MAHKGGVMATYFIFGAVGQMSDLRRSPPPKDANNVFDVRGFEKFQTAVSAAKSSKERGRNTNTVLAPKKRKVNPTSLANLKRNG
jgi:hypothetical protein